MPHRDPRIPLYRRWLFIALCALALAVPGCRGCTGGGGQQQSEAEDEQEQEDEEEKRKEQDFVIGRPTPQPNQAEAPSMLVKPGHWTTSTQSMKANYDDWVGESTQQVTNRQGDPIPIDRTRFSVRSQRPVALSKGQEKSIETTFFVPPAEGGISLRMTLSERGGLGIWGPDIQPVTKLLPHQYYFLVLAAAPEKYQFLKSVYSVNAPLRFNVELVTEEVTFPAPYQYRVVAPAVDDRAPLPDNALCLTTTAYIMWDGVDPKLFDARQRDALVDWLHWGGQLVVSGPNSLDLLRGSFLAPYLPAESGGAREITQSDVEPLVRNWAASERQAELSMSAPWSGVELKLVDDAADVEVDKMPVPAPRRDLQDKIPVTMATAQLQCGGLFAERRVGRGRVIVSAMRLTENELLNWKGGFDNLMNAVVLRRPPREFHWDPIGTGLEADGQVFVEWAGQERVVIDPAYNTGVRMLSRDTYDEAQPWRYPIANAGDGGGAPGAFPVQVAGSDWLGIRPTEKAGGPGGWDDFNQLAGAARQALREAAGVTVPGASFVIGCIAVYLLVLAPFNWMFFRALGRVEWAWVAAPVIAVAGTVLVVKQAQLDIGFVRAQSEVALLETQPGYDRGCLTRFTAVYTSLGTNYEMIFDDPTAVAAPFASDDEFTMLTGQRLSGVSYDRREKARLSGISVTSNTTDMVHSEEMHAQPALRLGRSSAGGRQLENPTGLDLRHVAVVRRPEDGAEALEGCYVGPLRTGASSAVSFLPLESPEDAAPMADRRQQDAAGERADELNLEPLWSVALDPRNFEPGEVRAVARVDQSLPGLEVSPEAAQQRGATLIVAHLRYGPPPRPRSDVNAPIDVNQAQN